MLCTTLGYIEKDSCYLMMHRIKKQNDISKEKWIGIGGKLEEGETPLQGMIRECKEETGLDWTDARLAGIVTFNFTDPDRSDFLCEQMFLFTGSEFHGQMKESDEGELHWIAIDELESKNLWKGDLIFFKLLALKAPFFFLKLDYRGSHLLSASINNLSIDVSFESMQQIVFPENWSRI